jgi:hypothetical protein
MKPKKKAKTKSGTKLKTQKAKTKPVSLFALRSELQAAHDNLADLLARIEHMIDRGTVPKAMPMEFAQARRGLQNAINLH